jgi:hypothetical protein
VLRTVGYDKIPEDTTIKCRIKSSDNPRLTKLSWEGHLIYHDITMVITTTNALTRDTNSTRKGILA